MLLYYAFVFLHVLVCLILILVVLLQSGKGADLAGAFGGGATQTAFGSRGPASFLSKVTTGAAIVFMITSIALSGLSPGSSVKSVLDSTKQGPAPVQQPATAAKPQAKPPTPEEIKKQVEESEAKQKQAAPAKAPEQPSAPAAKTTPPAEKKK